MLLLEVSTPHGPELNLKVSALQSRVLLLEVSNPQGPVSTYNRMCLFPYCCTCSLHFENNFLSI